MKEKRQRTPLFNDWYAFELLPQHLELEALQTYERWTARYAEDLLPIEDYWRDRVELVTALKESAVAMLQPRPIRPRRTRAPPVAIPSSRALPYRVEDRA